MFDFLLQECDGSILINNGDLDTERIAIAHQILGVFDEINKAKSKLETKCPGAVSYADIVVLAYRDVVVLLIHIFPILYISACLCN